MPCNYSSVINGPPCLAYGLCLVLYFALLGGSKPPPYG